MQFKVKENLSRIQEEIAPYRPNIIAVTKYFDEEAIIAAYQAGLRNFGESRVAEAIEKIARLPQQVRENSTFHFIGHLQSNKVKKTVEHFDLIQSVDSLKLAQAISGSAKALQKVQKILLQLNNANEVQKFGFSKEELFEAFPELLKLENLEVAGLMSMAPLGADEETLKTLFTDVAETKKQLEEKYNCKMNELSMGMSQDYAIAARCGATMLRIGRKLFS
ncbi:TPA: YggS family pyridoxal phosphate-dependent enzyme [Candidatus Scatenecus faecavium]|uniref:Pyridoxal phosphate homeostasis protein n=1 Tax=Candidatus Scatenecus faecavium TaxID=2840915 RepID=A0A9D1FXE8_9BACT|nr:YggS family pyridoxal phosphate-dependent enzyme [Candidatus Scatenecus faecavium]